MLFVCAVAWGSRQGFHSYLWHLRNAFAAAVSDPKPHTGHCRFHCAPSIMDYPFVPPPGILEVVCCRESCVRLSIEGSLIRGWCSCRWRLRKIFVFHFSFVVFLFVSSGFSFSRGRPVISSNRSERTALDQYRTPGPVEVWSVWALGYVGSRSCACSGSEFTLLRAAVGLPMLVIIRFPIVLYSIGTVSDFCC